MTNNANENERSIFKISAFPRVGFIIIYYIPCLKM